MTDTRSDIRDAALKLFLERGYAKTPIGAIEAAAGLAPRAGTFYRHYKSKADLLAEIARAEITETPQKFDLDRLRELGDTRAELVTIAQTYETIGAKQAPYLELIEEVRRTEEGAAFEGGANDDMLDALAGWVASKPNGAGRETAQLYGYTMLIFGGWLFYLAKLQRGVRLDTLSRNAFLNQWADIWAADLDQTQ